MEKARQLAKGSLASVIGPEAGPIDEFYQELGLQKIAEATVEVLDQDTLKMLQAYADGVNDYLTNIGYFREEISAFYLPLEFWAHNYTSYDAYNKTKEAD